MAERDFNSASFNQFLSEKKLMASKCAKCGAIYLPPRPLCTKCQSTQMEWVQMKGQGKLAAFTAISVGPSFMCNLGYDRNNPYLTGIVHLDEGPKISARLLNLDAKHPEQIKMAVPMTVEFVDAGEGEAKKTYLAFKAL